MSPSSVPGSEGGSVGLFGLSSLMFVFIGTVGKDVPCTLVSTEAMIQCATLSGEG